VESNGQPDSHIYVMNVDGSNPVRLTTDAVKHESPRWSPDGQQILYMSWAANGDSEPKVMNGRRVERAQADRQRVG
jgi:Tol biopolymer transport system component